MNQLAGFPLLSLVVWLPAIGALALQLLPAAQTRLIRQVSLAFALAAFLISLLVVFGFDRRTTGYQFVDSLPWVPGWGLSYRLSVDGISLWLVILTTFLTPISLIASWDTVAKDERLFTTLLLLLASGMTGVFVAQDMLLFYVFFELTLVPTALLIGRWGGEGRVAAATKFFLYPFAGSVFMLVGIIALYLAHGAQTGVYSFDHATILASMQLGNLRLDQTTERVLFFLFLAGFIVKVPVWPFHTWMPQAHEAAPSSGAVDVAGMMIKIGAYGLIRFNIQLFPAAAVWAGPALATLAVISILASAWTAATQRDMKRVLAYGSISHLGFIVLGIFAIHPLGIAGAVLAMVNSGITMSALFLIVGMLAQRGNSRDLADFSGVWKAAPILGSLAFVMMMASIGLPGLNGFIGEFSIMQGAWLSPSIGYGFVTFAAIGVILSAVYMLRMFRMAFMGDVNGMHMPDLTAREAVLLVTLLVPTIAIGLYPNLIFGPMQTSVNQFAEQFGAIVASR